MKRKKGEGTIREYKPGKWTARITVNGNVKAFYGSSEREVSKKLKEFKEKLSMGIKDYKKNQYSDFLDLWLERKRMELKPQSFFRLESTVEIHVKPILGFYFLDKIDSDIIQEDIIKPKIKELSYSSVKKIYDAINSSMKFARSKGMIAQNPVDLVVLPPQSSKLYVKNNSKKSESLEIFTDDEIPRFVTAANAVYTTGEPIYPNGGMFILMLNTGLRLGDAYVKHTTQKNMKIFSSNIKTQRPFKMFGVIRLSFYINRCKFPVLFFCFYRAAFGSLCQAHDTKKGLYIASIVPLTVSITLSVKSFLNVK